MNRKFIMKTQSQFVIGLLLVAVSMACLAAPPERSGVRSAEGLPEYYPSTFQKTGVIRDVAPDDTLVISGLKYHLTPDTKIHTTRNEFSSRWSLKSGEEVGISFSTDGANRRTISEIWLLPAGRVVSH